MNGLAVGIQTEGIVFDDCPPEGFERIRRAGFSCCGFGPDFGRDSGSGAFFERSAEELKRFFAHQKEAAAAAGVRISHLSLTYADCLSGAAAEKDGYPARTAVARGMELCAYLECPYLVVRGLDAAGGTGVQEAAWERTERLLKPLARQAEEMKINICVENAGIYVGNHTAEGTKPGVREAAMRIDRMNENCGAEIFGFCFDTGNANLAGADVEDCIRTLGHRLKVLCVQDNDGVDDLHLIPFTAPGRSGEGAGVDWKGVIRGLQRIRFDGMINFETGPAIAAFPEVMRQDVLRFIAQIGSYFAGEILSGDSLQDSK